jgi:hypothetical protein
MASLKNHPALYQGILSIPGLVRQAIGGLKHEDLEDWPSPSLPISWMLVPVVCRISFTSDIEAR